MENLVVKEQCEVLVRTTKATILRANNDYSNIIAFTAFDQKSVHFLSTIMKNITWLSN